MRNYVQMFIFLMILIICLLSSCEKTVPYDTSSFEKKIVVESIVENGEAEIYLSQNISTLSKDTFIPINNAEVYINNIKIYQKNDCYSYQIPDCISGKELNLFVSKNGFPSITSNLVVPSKPSFKILSSRLINNQAFIWTDKYVEITIQIDENQKNSSDYYIIELIKTKYAIDENYNASTGQWDKTLRKYKFDSVFLTTDNVAEIVQGDLGYELNKKEFTLEDDFVFPRAIIISDKTFDGKNKILTLMTGHDFQYQYYQISISSINAEFYSFIQSAAAYNFNNSMFNEPLRIKSNIEGGLGYFGIKTTTIDSIKIIDIK